MSGNTKNKCDCSIELLLNRPFKSMKLEEKLLIIEKGKPTPDIKLKSHFSSSRCKKNFTRHFNPKCYGSLPWLCGCDAIKKLFCWPCLLFSKQESIWSTTGYDNLQNIAKCERRHQASAAHIIALKEMKKFTKVFGPKLKSKPILSGVKKKEIELHNLRVKKNRFAFKHLTKVVGSLGKLAIDLESGDSANKLHFEEMLKLVSGYNTELKFFMVENSDCLLPQVKKIPSALTECLIEEIKKEISQASYLSLILDGVTDSDNKDYVCATLRYIKGDGETIDRLVRYWETTSSTSSIVFDNIQHVLLDFNCALKLVSYSYDNAIVKPADVAFYVELNERIKRSCKNAVNVHYFAHDLADILLKSVSHIEGVRLFIADLSTFGDFFSQSNKRLQRLKSFQKNLVFEWNNPLQLAESVHDNRLVLLNMLIAVIANTSEWDATTVSQTSDLLRLLRDFDFYFFLSLFSSIHKQCKVTYRGFLSNLTQSQNCYVKVSCFANFLTLTKNTFNAHLNDAVTTTPKSYKSNINKMICSVSDIDKMAYWQLYGEILERIFVTCHERFKNYDQLELLCLLDRKQFKKHYLSFPQKAVSRLLDYYPYDFQEERLRNELYAIYSDLEFRSVYNLHGYITFQELEDVFPETLKLSRMFGTMPLAVESTSSTDRIRSFVKKNRMSETIFMAIEKDLLEVLLEQERFLEKVVDKLAVIENRDDLLYQSLDKEPGDDLGSETNTIKIEPNSEMPIPKLSDVAGADSPDIPGISIKEEHLAMTCDFYPVSPQDTNSLSAEAESSENTGDGSLFQPTIIRIKEEPVSSEE